jgi:hypothetical protein
MVYGNEGDEISFRCYDHKNDSELYMISETSINFQTNVMTGDVLEPFVFSFKSYQYNVSVDVVPETGGTVSGGGIYKHGDEVSLVANPNDGYIFLNWTENDSVFSEDADYTFIITSDRNLNANFEKIEEPEDPIEPIDPGESIKEYVSSYNLYPNPASDFIMIENSNQYDVTMYDMSGRIVLEEKPNDGRINVSHLPDGTYVVSVNKESTTVIINRR